MQAVLMLADWADAINGKLYIQGGGWSSVIRSPQGQINFAIACKIFVGWTEANRKHEISITLRDEDGGTYEPMPGEPFVIKSIIEVGRPAGLREGSEIDAPLALNIGGLPIVPGRYKLELSVGNNEITSVVFDVR